MNNNNIIDKYELLEKLGEGAFGIVFKARNTLFNKIVALKIIKGSSSEQRDLFLREIRKMDKLTPSHLNVINILSADIKNDVLLIEMEYFEGKNLQRLLNENSVLDEDTIVEYISQILEGLSFIHSKRLVHRDLKPDNILLNKDESLVKISDFGISKDLDYSTSDSIQGTVLYMSPEQLTDPTNIDYRSDFYSLAIIIFQLKMGVIPFAGSITNIIDGKRFKSIPKTNSFLDAIIQKASKKNPNERYENADEFKFELLKAFEKSKKKNNSIYYVLYTVLIIFSLLLVFRKVIFSSNEPSHKTEEINKVDNSDKSTIRTINLIEQTWMIENLKVKEFRYGTPIKEVHNKEQWDDACKNKIPAFCHVYDEPSNDEKYGLLYNWYAAKDSICPEGFVIPTKEDFEKLLSNYDFSSLLSRFKNVYPGYRNSDDGYFPDFNNGLIIWSKSEKYSGCVYTLRVFKTTEKMNLGELKPTDGYSIRCIKKVN